MPDRPTPEQIILDLDTTIHPGSPRAISDLRRRLERLPCPHLRGGSVSVDRILDDLGALPWQRQIVKDALANERLTLMYPRMHGRYAIRSALKLIDDARREQRVRSIVASQRRRRG